jgi:hypothetical protein
VVVLWDGSDDVERSNSDDSIKHTLGFVRKSNHINVIVMIVPHRQDLIRNPCVNNTGEAFDRRLWNRMKRFENVEMINVVIDRDLYMKHGLYMNTRGIEKMLMKITSTIKSMLGERNETYQYEMEK